MLLLLEGDLRVEVLPTADPQAGVPVDQEEEMSRAYEIMVVPGRRGRRYFARVRLGDRTKYTPWRETPEEAARMAISIATRGTEESLIRYLKRPRTEDE